MARITITEALREMRHLDPVDAGRLSTVQTYDSFLSRPDQWLAHTPAPWRDRLLTAITDRFAGTITPDTPEYVVLSDKVAVAVLTVTAQVVLPDYPLSANQTKHQAAAVQVLRDLPRDTLRKLADQRAAWDGRDEDAAAEYKTHPQGALRVAPAADPTNTRWVHIGADLPAARRTLAAACHTDPDQILVITAAGYGTHGHQRHRLDLPVLCAMHHLADTHRVSPGTVGDWLDAEGAPATEVNPATIIAQFAAAYLGAYPDRTAYTRARMAELGWTQAIAAAGIPEQYLDIQAVTRDWFRTEVRDVPANKHIEVFRRHRPEDGPTPAPTG